MNEDNIDFTDDDEYESAEIVVGNSTNEDIKTLMKGYNKKKKSYKTFPTITKYEKCRVLSERANQINYGGQVYISNFNEFSNAYDIAVQEYNEKKIPFIIKRPYGNGFEYWKLNDLL